jgi:HK97 family phage prohead protease
MNFKNFDIQYKEDDAGNGVISGYASTFDLVPDAYGDIVKKGAFEKSLKQMRDEGKKIPFLWSHKMDDLNAYLGTADAYEDDKGLFFTATLDDTPQAQRVRELFKSGRLSKFSFAYDVIEQAPMTLDNGVKVNQLIELKLYEITACLVPANSFAEVTDVKDINVSEKAGRRNSAADEQTIRNAIALLQEILGEVVNNAESENNDDDNAKAKAKDQVIVNEKAQKLLDFINNM